MKLYSNRVALSVACLSIVSLAGSLSIFSGCGSSVKPVKPDSMQDSMMSDGMMKDGMMKDSTMKDGMMKDGMMKDGAMKDGANPSAPDMKSDKKM